MPRRYCLLSLLVFLSYLTSPSSSTCNPDDKKALQRIKAHFNNAPIFATWDPTTDCCIGRWAPWGGIQCDTNGRVTLIALGVGKDVVGAIPSAMGDLPYLNYLIFSGSPGISGPIPLALAKLTKLQHLDFSSNNLTGSIPDFLGQLTGLDEIDLSGNSLTGPIPRSLISLPNITSLDISQNKFTGDASFLFGSKKTGLTSIKLSNNLFKFDFSNVDLSPGLKTIDISHNMIYGSLPIKLGQLPLESIDVSYNRLCGPIPAGPRLKQFSPVKFSNNKCLCGPPLAPCKS